MNRTNPTVIPIYNNSILIIASAVSIARNQAHLKGNEQIAAVLVITGVYLVNMSKKKNLTKDENIVATDEKDLTPNR